MNELLSESKINENKTIQVIELLSRFCIRVKFEFKENLLNVSFDLFNNETFKKSHRLSSSLCNLFGRIIISMDNNQQKSIVLKLINLPIPGVNNFIVISPYNWVELILFIEKALNFRKF
ncbi:MAG: hypothetical protein IPL16_11635 [Ignavibacteria bacterium]|nr:hypothetical protein [Ignavibacteria bacterium]